MVLSHKFNNKTSNWRTIIGITVRNSAFSERCQSRLDASYTLYLRGKKWKMATIYMAPKKYNWNKLRGSEDGHKMSYDKFEDKNTIETFSTNTGFLLFLEKKSFHTWHIFNINQKHFHQFSKMVRKYCSAREKKNNNPNQNLRQKGLVWTFACLKGHLAVFYADSSLTRPVTLSANKSCINTNTGLCQGRGDAL